MGGIVAGTGVSRPALSGIARPPTIEKETCLGCGLCVANCPSDALELRNLAYLYELAKARG